ALADYVDLSVESVRGAETEIARRQQSDVEAAEEEFEERTQRIRRRLAAFVEVMRREFGEQFDQLRSSFDSATGAVADERRTTRDQVVQESQSAGREARNQYDKDTWLAESVVEATKTQLDKESKRLKKEGPARIAALDAINQRAYLLLSEYRHPPRVESDSDDGSHSETDVPQADVPQAGVPQAGVTQEEAPGAVVPLATYKEQREAATRHLRDLQHLWLPRLFVGYRMHTLVVLLCVSAVVLLGFLTVSNSWSWDSFAYTGPSAFFGTLLVAAVAAHGLRRVARSHVDAVFTPLDRSLGTARAAADQYSRESNQRIQQREAQCLRTRDREVRRAKDQFGEAMAEIGKRRDSALQRIEEHHARSKLGVEQQKDRSHLTVEERQQERLSTLNGRYERILSLARQRRDARLDQARRRFESERSELERRWSEGIARLQELVDETRNLDGRVSPDWNHAAWKAWAPTDSFASWVRFGHFDVDLARIAADARGRLRFEAGETSSVLAPAMLAFPDRCSLLLQSDRAGREEAIGALQAVMFRLLASLPPGRVHFTILDPVGLGENFAGFMHLADYDEDLIGGRIWTDNSHIEQRLTDLTNHMENVIQKYLRNEFETIDAYNVQAGELAEPYRFLVVANFPVGFTEASIRRLCSIVGSGARCGVYTLIAQDTRQVLPPGIEATDLAGDGVHLVHKDNRFVWNDEVFGQFPLVLDFPPPESTLTQMMQVIGKAARQSKRVEVPFETIAPKEDQIWTRESADDLSIPVGRTGAVRLQSLRLGEGVAQHGLIAGKTGSGKSTLLHVIITNLALWYRPDEVELYLVDFKEGVEFKCYATHELPHARAVAIESDREFGLSVLQRINTEMERRGELFRERRVQDIGAYRRAGGDALPRTLLIVDEFQMFFSEEDKLAQDASMLLDRLVRQGRAFGIHVLLGSQTLGGSSGLPRSTMGQMAVRIALQCAEADSQLILNDDNFAARLLSRPGEAIYNDAGGLVEGNSPFQTAWLSDKERDECLIRIREYARSRMADRRRPTIFEGNAPADIRTNGALADLLESPGWGGPPAAPRVWLGEAVAIKDPTSVTFRRQSGANLIVVGQRDDAAMGIMTAAMASLAAQHAPDSARFYVLDGTATDSPLSGVLSQVAASLPHPVRMVNWREVAEVVAELAAEAAQRLEADRTDAHAVYLLIFGLQRYRMLRRSEDDFSFSRDEAGKPPNPDKLFAELLREGPPFGLHVMTWCDTPISLERTLDRQSLREFDNRVLFQMSATDSSNLIDSPAANQLGFYRALFCSEEEGVLEKFRPYAFMDRQWLDSLKDRFARKGSATRPG
ncbi:MAG: FtsK/SpoIIIE domain-containing protein, partial [Planctomycetota bacterium]|nr:FtsK/SpoIIIE domain-containing protein [Planctomycetota bacterium]